jgi:hypothetical protein
MADSLYRQWMRRLQLFLASRPAPQRARGSAAAVRHDVAVRA